MTDHLKTSLLLFCGLFVFLISCDSTPQSNSLDKPQEPFDPKTSAEESSDSNFLNKTWTIQGRVVDPSGTRVKVYDAASIWSSNGKYWNDAGEVPTEGQAQIWKNEGDLANRPQFSATVNAEGEFSLEVSDRPRAPVLAVSKDRTLGGLVLVNRRSSEEALTVRLSRLTRVTANLYCPEAGKSPKWGLAQIYLAGGDNIPITSCGTYQGHVSFLLPAGKYEINASATGPDSRMPAREIPTGTPSHGIYSRGQPFVVKEGESELDLGTLELCLPKDSEGKSVDTTNLYTGPAPALSFRAARGISNDSQLSDFNGKWVLLDFWSIGCLPCVTQSIPELIEFHSKNSDLSDQFEILSICDTSHDGLSTITEYEERTAKIRGTHWNGKRLPFPVLLDTEGKTHKTYGISRLPTIYLVAPNGIIVEDGDLQTLSERLEEIRESRKTPHQ